MGIRKSFKKTFLIGVILILLVLEIVCSKFLFNPRKVLSYKSIKDQSEWLDSLKGWDLPVGVWNTGISGKDSLIISESRSRESYKFETGTHEKLVSIYGASYAFGQGLENDKVFTASLQNEFPEFKIHNKSVPGYSTIQMLYKFKEDLKLRKEKPDLVILSWLHFHAYRNNNTKSNKIQSELMMLSYSNNTSTSIPQCSLEDDSIHYSYAKTTDYPIHKSWLLRKSALCLTSYYVINREYEERNYNFHFEASKYVIKDFMKVCDTNGIKFCLVGMDQNKMDLIQEWCNNQNICYYNMGLQCENSPEYSQKDDPLHPNAKAHGIFFEKITNLVKVQMN